MTKWRITEITHYPGTKKESKEYLVEKLSNVNGPSSQ